MMMTVGASLGGLFFALFGVALLEYRARRVDRVDEVVLGLGMRLVGTVPPVRRTRRNTSGKPIKGEDSGQQVLTESVDAARTMLLHLVRDQGLHTVMVSSAVAGEGKTSLSCRLAASLARAGLRTLLVDADTRNPSVHKVFGVSCDPGFCEILCGGTDLASAVKATPVPGLSLLCSGRWSEQMPCALGRGQASVLFDQLRQQFDIILVDSPPPPADC
jgi:Mrp family chromosome partitioning ATPase